MTIQCVLLTPTHAAALVGMTFPLYRPLLVSADINVVAIAAIKNGVAIGLMLARSDEALLLSLFVNAQYRRQGVGRRLLMGLESELARCGCKMLTTVWTSSLPCADAFSALLRAQAWSLPQARMIIYQAELARLRDAHWMYPLAALPEGYAMVSWADLRPEQIRRLQQALRFESWIPPDLNPFDFVAAGIDGALAVPQLSFATVAWGEVVGWNLVHRIDARSVRASCTFVHPDLQRRMLLVPIWCELLDRARGTEYQTVSWTVAVEREAMRKFNDKHMTPFLLHRAESLECHKILAPAETDKVACSLNADSI